MGDYSRLEAALQGAELEAALQDLEKKGLVLACGQRWAEHSGRMQTVYKPAPGRLPGKWDAFDTTPSDAG